MLFKLIALFLSSLVLCASDSEKILQELKLTSYPVIDVTRMNELDYLPLFLESINLVSNQKAVLRKKLLASLPFKNSLQIIETSKINKDFLYQYFPEISAIKKITMDSYNSGRSLYFVNRSALPNLIVKEINLDPNYKLVAEIDEERALGLIAEFFADIVLSPQAMNICQMHCILKQISEKQKSFVVLERALGNPLAEVLKTIADNQLEQEIKNIFLIIGKSKALLDINITIHRQQLLLDREAIGVKSIRSVIHNDFHSDNIFVTNDMMVSTIDNSGMVFSLYSPKTIDDIIAIDFKKLCENVAAEQRYLPYLELMKRALLEGYTQALPVKPSTIEFDELLSLYEKPYSFDFAQ